MSTYVRSYGSPSRLFVNGGKELSSSEETTQRDAFAMPAYVVAIVPFLTVIKEDDNGSYISRYDKRETAFKVMFLAVIS